jgi:hypothetical protein
MKKAPDNRDALLEAFYAKIQNPKTQSPFIKQLQIIDIRALN